MRLSEGSRAFGYIPTGTPFELSTALCYQGLKTPICRCLGYPERNLKIGGQWVCEQQAEIYSRRSKKPPIACSKCELVVQTATDRPNRPIEIAAKSSHSRLRLTMFSPMNWTKPGSLAALLLSKLLVKRESATVSSPLD